MNLSYSKIIWCFLAVTIVSMTSCLNDEPDQFTAQDQFEADQKIIGAYLDENNIDAETDSVYGLYYKIHQQGDGEYPKQSDKINVSYIGRFFKDQDSTVFDQNDSIEFQLNSLIVGWRILLPYLKEGGEMTMYLPRGAAYGTDNIEFDITLNEIK